MGKKLIAYILCLTYLFAPQSMIKEQQYTIYIPDEPTSIIMYYHPNMSLVHTNSETQERPQNFYEGVIQTISKNNPNSIIIVTYYSNKTLLKKVQSYIDKYNIKDILISGWSAGGNFATEAAAALASDDLNIKLLYIDCNHTNQLNPKCFKTIAKYNITIHYTSNVTGDRKNKVLKNAMAEKIPIIFYKLTIPKDFSGSNHIQCRDCAIFYNLYGYILGTAELHEDYQLGYYDYEKHKSIF